MHVCLMHDVTNRRPLNDIPERDTRNIQQHTSLLVAYLLIKYCTSNEKMLLKRHMNTLSLLHLYVRVCLRVLMPVSVSVGFV